MLSAFLVVVIYLGIFGMIGAWAGQRYEIGTVARIAICIGIYFLIFIANLFLFMSLARLVIQHGAVTFSSIQQLSAVGAFMAAVSFFSATGKKPTVEINEATARPNFSAPLPQPSSRSITNFLITIFVFVLLMVVAGSTVFFIYTSQRQASQGTEVGATTSADFEDGVSEKASNPVQDDSIAATAEKVKPAPQPQEQNDSTSQGQGGLTESREYPTAPAQRGAQECEQDTWTNCQSRNLTLAYKLSRCKPQQAPIIASCRMYGQAEIFMAHTGAHCGGFYYNDGRRRLECYQKSSQIDWNDKDAAPIRGTQFEDEGNIYPFEPFDE